MPMLPSDHDPALAGALADGLRALPLDLPPAAVDRLLRYLALIGQWNRVYNLTAVREPSAMLTQHLLDCLAIVPALCRGLGPAAAGPLRVLDVGSGAGLPGVVLAICQLGWDVTCVDAVAKKASFIRQVGAELGLPNLHATHQRVETLGGEPFQLITSRAFATLADFVALTRGCLAPDGQWVAMKANLGDEERAGVPHDIDMFHVEPLTVPGLSATRCLVWMRPKPASR